MQRPQSMDNAGFKLQAVAPQVAFDDEHMSLAASATNVPSYLDDSERKPHGGAKGAARNESNVQLLKSKWLWMTTSAICVGSSFQFGYNIGVVNTPQTVIENWLNTSYQSLHSSIPSPPELNLLWSVCTSIFGVGGVFGALASGQLGRHFGRKIALMLNSSVSFIAALLMGCSILTDWFYILMFGRFCIGVCCGVHTALAPQYLTEIAPVAYRGVFGTLNQLFITIGIVVSEVLGLPVVLGSDRLWSLLLAFTCVPTLYQLAVLPFCPDSPKFLLIVREDRTGAENALRQLRGRFGDGIEDELKEMQYEHQKISALPSLRIRDFFTRRELLLPLVIACVMMLSQQLCGSVAVLFYSTAIFESAGLPKTQATYVTIGMGFIFVLMTFVSVALIERAGRRTLQLSGLFGMWVCSLLLFGSLILMADGNEWASFVAAALVIAFIVSFAIGPGSIPWFFVYELFEQNAITIAATIAVSVSWLALFVAGLMFLPLIESIEEYSFLVYTGLLTAFIVFTFVFAPETKNRPISEIVDGFRQRSFYGLRSCIER